MITGHTQQLVARLITVRRTESVLLFSHAHTHIHTTLTVLHAFKQDVDDPERPAFPVVHFGHYYQAYTGKNFDNTLKAFACSTFEELTRLVPEICRHTHNVDEFALRKSDALLRDFDLVWPAQDLTTEVLLIVNRGSWHSVWRDGGFLWNCESRFQACLLRRSRRCRDIMRARRVVLVPEPCHVCLIGFIS